MQSKDQEIKQILEEKAVLQQKLIYVNKKKENIKNPSDDMGYKKNSNLESSSQSALNDSGVVHPTYEDLKKCIPQTSFGVKAREAITAEKSTAINEHKVSRYSLRYIQKKIFS